MSFDIVPNELYAQIYKHLSNKHLIMFSLCNKDCMASLIEYISIAEYKKKLLDTVVKYGGVGLIKRFDRLYESTHRIMMWQIPNINLVKWLHENSKDGCTIHAMNKVYSLEMVKWLHANRTEGCTTDAMDNAARDGKLDIVVWLSIYRKEGCTSKALKYAVDNCHFEVVKWLYKKYPNIMTNTVLCNVLPTRPELGYIREWLMIEINQKLDEMRQEIARMEQVNARLQRALRE